MSDKDNLANSINDDSFILDHCSDALHQLTRQAEQALRAQQNNQNTEVKPEEPQE